MKAASGRGQIQRETQQLNSVLSRGGFICTAPHGGKHLMAANFFRLLRSIKPSDMSCCPFVVFNIGVYINLIPVRHVIDALVILK